MLTNQSRIDGVRGVHERSETSSKEDLLETFAKERKIRDCTRSPRNFGPEWSICDLRPFPCLQAELDELSRNP